MINKERQYLDQGVVCAVLADTLYGDLSVRVVVAVVVADPDQLAVVGTRAGVSHLTGEEVRESLRIKAVDVVDGVSLPGKGVDKHPRPSSDGSLGNL